MWTPWSLRRNPLSPTVPLEGSDTVQGLRLLERERMLAELQGGEGSSGGRGRGGGAAGGWRRAFQRYKGPFIEQLGVEDLKQAPKNWTVFWKGSERGQLAEAYNLPASLDVLVERTEENFVSFLPNYLRLAAGVLLATFYLRPKALVGAVAVVYSMYRSVTLAYRRQLQEAAAEAERRQGRAGGQHQQQRPTAAAAAAAADPNEQLVTAASTVVTWLLVAYTRCLPMLLLGSLASLVTVLLHCALRRAPSEYRHKGRQLLGFTWRQVLGREPVPEGADPRAVFRQVAAATGQAVRGRCRQAWWYCRYCAANLTNTLLYTIKNPRSLFSR